MKNVILLLIILFASACTLKMPQTQPVFELNKGQCRGTCPVYTLKVYENGFVKFDGRKHVDLLGSYKGQINKEELKRLITVFEKANFFKFENEYRAMVMDLPTIQIEFRDGKNVKRITDYYGAPAELKTLEQELETVISLARLKPTTDNDTNQIE